MSRLLDVADVNPADGRAWRLGYETSARGCNAQVEFAEACDDSQIAVIGTETSFGPEQYKTVPFPIQGFLRQGTLCQQSDDGPWFRAAFADLAEHVLTRALVIQAAAGNQSWIGDSTVTTQTLSDSTDAVLDAALAAARETWFASVIGGGGNPIMHVPPSMVSRLVRLGWLVKFGADQSVESYLDDEVVVGSGYGPNPHVFFSGPIIVRLTDISLEDNLVNSRINLSTIAVDRLGMVDVAPCSIVKVGA